MTRVITEMATANPEAVGDMTINPTVTPSPTSMFHVPPVQRLAPRPRVINEKIVRATTQVKNQLSRLDTKAVPIFTQGEQTYEGERSGHDCFCG